MVDEKLALTGMVFMLGIRHGFELDHLAVIDGMVSCAPLYSRLSKWMGFLFSLGHGIIIIAFTIFIASRANHWDIPAWMERLGMGISVVSLLFFGLYSLYRTFKKNKAPIKLYGSKSFLFNKYSTHGRVSFLTPLCTGMVFSLSFDTLTVTMAFSLNGYALGGNLLPVLLGIAFMGGMMLTDGLNSYLIARMLHRASKRSQGISRLLDGSIGCFSLLTGIFYLLQMHF